LYAAILYEYKSPLIFSADDFLDRTIPCIILKTKRAMNLLKIILCLFLIVYSCASANAQSRTLTGKVISSKDGNGVPGATISIKQNSKSFSASNDGSFSISVPPGIITLTVSYVGYAIKKLLSAQMIITSVFSLMKT
jgi:hypothetical protein